MGSVSCFVKFIKNGFHNLNSGTRIFFECIEKIYRLFYCHCIVENSRLLNSQKHSADP
jgi:hypothetical protein